MCMICNPYGAGRKIHKCKYILDTNYIPVENPTFELLTELKYNESGVYKIVNIATNNFYIGSSKNLKRRYKAHNQDLINKKHPNKLLQNDFHKYGKFIMSVIEYCDPNIRKELEQKYIDDLNPYYNIVRKVSQIKKLKWKLKNKKMD